ncbi:MAG: formyltransferase [Betaproteobacteria bacterium]|nr:MAG: formyltransferase [Betaproteobacteria bacterium]
MIRAVVFAYHNVGVRCLETLRGGGVEIGLVVTHADDPAERVWFESVAGRAGLYGIPVIVPQDPNTPEVIERVRALAPDILFSFYYRSMLGGQLLGMPRLGAFNMHGSLLPKYRGRAPINWAILHGERETGASLHEMVAKPDAGRIVDRQRVPILPNDLAHEVLDKVTVAAEIVLERSLPALLAGTARLEAQDLAAGSYFGRREPKDGAIDVAWPAARIHNLVRAVAPPYPGAFCAVMGRTLRLLRTFDCGERAAVPGRPMLLARGPELHLHCADGGVLRILAAEYAGTDFDADRMRAMFAAERVPVETGDSNT